jgi:hypothetical protein
MHHSKFVRMAFAISVLTAVALLFGFWLERGALHAQPRLDELFKEGPRHPTPSAPGEPYLGVVFDPLSIFGAILGVCLSER